MTRESFIGGYDAAVEHVETYEADGLSRPEAIEQAKEHLYEHVGDADAGYRAALEDMTKEG